MGWRRGEAGGVEREDRGEAVEGQEAEEGVGVAGGVGMVSLGLGRSEVGVALVAGELDEEEEGPALRVAGDNGLGFGVDELPVSEGSMAGNKKAHQTTNQAKENSRFKPQAVKSMRIYQRKTIVAATAYHN